MVFVFRTVLLSLLIFAVLVVFTPMVSIGEGFCDAGPFGNCAPTTRVSPIFPGPVVRTAVCEAWHQPGCAPDTFLPGWFDGLLNIYNLMIILALGALSSFVGLTLARRNRR